MSRSIPCKRCFQHNLFSRSCVPRRVPRIGWSHLGAPFCTQRATRSYLSSKYLDTFIFEIADAARLDLTPRIQLTSKASCRNVCEQTASAAVLSRARRRQTLSTALMVRFRARLAGYTKALAAALMFNGCELGSGKGGCDAWTIITG